MAFGLLLSIGTAVKLSIKLGEKKISEAEGIIGNALVLSVFTGLAMTAAGFVFMNPLLIAFGGNGVSLDYSRQFMQIVLFSSVFQMIGMTLNSSIRAEGNPILALWTMVIGSILNTILNPFFIFILHMGVKGSALATMISQFATSVWTFIYFIDSRNIIRLRMKNLALKREYVAGIISIGTGHFLPQIALSILLLVINHVFGKYGGRDALAVIGIIGTINMLFSMIISGISQGIQPIFGYNYGAKNAHRVKMTLEISIIMSTALCVVFFLPIFFFSRDIMMIFSRDSQYIQSFGADGLKYSLLALPLLGFQIISISYFQAVGKYMQTIFLYILRQLLVIVPLLYILSVRYGFYGGIAAFPISDIIISAIVGMFIYLGWRKMPSEALTAAEA
jgi:putative MATE family efflux protein